MRIHRVALVCCLAISCGGSASGPSVESDTRTCIPASGTTGSPTSIDEAVALINGLPAPVTAACLVESLDRPLRVEMTSSINSAQPANGASDPRIFIFSDPLVISVVPSGLGADVVELSELKLDKVSVKAEIPFPVTPPYPLEAAFADIMFNETLTSCGICHPHETPDRSVGTATAYKSRAFRPEDRTLVDLEALKTEHDTCDSTAEADRCALLDAVFDNGDVREEHFLDRFPTQFESVDE